MKDVIFLAKFVVKLFFLYHFYLTNVEAVSRTEKLNIMKSGKISCAQGKVYDRKLLITGCSRSGTTFTSNYLTLCGLDVAHEVCGNYGTVSWMMAADSCFAPWGEGSLGYKFENTFHQVRDPLKCIASVMANELDASWDYICKFVPQISRREPILIRAAKYWYYWNLLSENKSTWTYRLEDLENNLAKMSSELGFYLDPKLLKKVPSDTNHRKDKMPVITWRLLEKELDPELFYNLQQLALKYGYSILD